MLGPTAPVCARAAARKLCGTMAVTGRDGLGMPIAPMPMIDCQNALATAPEAQFKPSATMLRLAAPQLPWRCLACYPDLPA